MRIYEQLSGEQGRKIYYRAERFQARSLFGMPTPRVEIGQNTYELQDLSMTGLGLLAPAREMLANKPGTVVYYRLRVGDAVLHEGSARVSRVHRQPHGLCIGLGLTSDYLDVPALITRQRDLLVRHEIEKLATPSEEIDPAYKLLVVDVLDLLRRYGSVLANQQPATRDMRRADDKKINEILDLCEERIIPEWRTLWHRANELITPIMGDPQALRDIKLYTERILTPEFVAGPIWRRAYEKPLGYPGDYHLMDQVYSWQRDGDTPFAKLVHRLGLEVAECIATRMVMIQQTIGEVVTKGAHGSTARVTSLGSGPAQEIQNFLRVQPLPRPVEFTLIDQEKAALACAYETIYPLTVTHAGAAKVSCLHVSFMDLLKSEDSFPPLRPQDLIYSVGLFDYLAPRRAANLVSALYRRLAPGGTLVIGNMNDTATGNLWPMEVICDWNLHYRSEAQMLAMVDGLDVSHAEVRKDPTGRVLLMFVRKS